MKLSDLKPRLVVNNGLSKAAFARAGRSEAMRKRHKDPKFAAIVRAAGRKTMLARWESEDYRKAKLAHAAEVMRRNNQNPEFRAKALAGSLASIANPKHHANRVAGLRKLFENPEIRAKRGAALKAARANPEFEQKRLARLKAAKA